MLVVPLDMALIPSATDGKKYPADTPIAIARNIQSVKYRSKKPNRFRSALLLLIIIQFRVYIKIQIVFSISDNSFQRFCRPRCQETGKTANCQLYGV